MAAPKNATRWLALVFLMTGLYIVLISLGVLPYTPRSKHGAVFDGPQHWQVTSIGLAFFCAGGTIILDKRNRWLNALLGMLLLLAWGAPMLWFVYFSGALSVPLRVIASFPLLLGLAGALWGLLRTLQGKSAALVVPRDPVHDADVFLAYGRTAQAKAVLLDAIKRYPARRAELQRKLEKIELSG